MACQSPILNSAWVRDEAQERYGTVQGQGRKQEEQKSNQICVHRPLRGPAICSRTGQERAGRWLLQNHQGWVRMGRIRKSAEGVVSEFKTRRLPGALRPGTWMRGVVTPS